MFRVILSANLDPYYLDFLPLVVKSWKKFFDCKVCLALVSDNPSEGKKYQDLVDASVIYSPNQNASIKSQGMSARLIYAGEFEDDFCIINDLDIVPLQYNYVRSLLSREIYGRLLAVGREFFDGTPHENKFPMGYFSGRGFIFKSVINPNNLNYHDLIQSWVGLHLFDNKEDISKDPPEFADESLIRALIFKFEESNGKDSGPVHIPLGYKMLFGNLDRYRWHIDLHRLYSLDYVDAHCPRPLYDNRPKLGPIIEFIDSLPDIVQ